MMYLHPNDGSKKIGTFDHNLTTPVIGERCFLAITEDGEEALLQTSVVQHFVVSPDGELTIETLNSIYKGHVGHRIAS